MSAGTVLVTGGAGYIGSHTAAALLDADYDVVVLDNFANSSPAAIAALRRATNRDVALIEGDVRDGAALERAFRGHEISAVCHFAAAKAVAESFEQPLAYYDHNVVGTLRLVEQMAAHGVKTLVFSSSATVYGHPAKVPITEDMPLAPINPYGRTKLTGEMLLGDLHRADPDWRISILRYFNPIGAHASGLLGDAPLGVPCNLMPYLGAVAAGRLPRLSVFGDDYPTPDGTCIRDYIHVVDLAKGHLKALQWLARAPGLAIHNLGTGAGHSVFEVMRAFEAASGRDIPHTVAPRRPGDTPVLYADPSSAAAELGWCAEHGLQRMCEDAWRHVAALAPGVAGAAE